MVSLRVERWYDYPRVCVWLLLLVPFYTLFGGYVWLSDGLQQMRETAKGWAVQGYVVLICAGVLAVLAVIIAMGTVHNLWLALQATRGRHRELVLDPGLENAGSGDSPRLVSSQVAV
jgi:hypothetical protein